MNGGEGGVGDAVKRQEARESGAPFDDATLAAYRAALVAFVSRRVPDRAEVDDLVQDALARLVMSAERHELREPQAYLFRIAANLVADYYSRNRRIGRTIPLEEHHAPIVRPEQEDGRHGDDLQRLFEAALDELGPKCRAAFVLHRFEEVPNWAIALRMKITPRMVQKHIVTATTHLYARLSQHMGDRL
jgi:RNA polymerase sigma factor (sigma-70 family)